MKSKTRQKARSKTRGGYIEPVEVPFANLTHAGGFIQVGDSTKVDSFGSQIDSKKNSIIGLGSSFIKP